MIHWKHTTLIDISQDFNGSIKTGPFGAQLHEYDYTDEGIPVIMPKDIVGNSVDETFIARIPEALANKFLQHKVKVGDIVFPRRGEISKRAFIKNGQVGFICGTGCIKISIGSSEFSTEYLNYFLAKKDTIEWLENNSVGATMKNLSGEILKKLPVSYPPLPTQKRIASILSAYDDLIENNLKRIKLLEEIAKRTYEEWFVKFRVNGEQLAIDEVTGLPVGWEIIKVGDLLDKVQSTIKIPSSEILSEGIIPVIDQSRDFVAGYTNEKLSMTSLSKPIIVFGDHTRVLKFIDFPFARGADGTQLILSKNNRMPQHLFYHSLLNIDLSNYHYARHFKYLKDSEIILPIEKYSNKYEGLIKPIFEKIKVLRFQNVKLKQSRDILLPRLMSGTINVES